MALVFKVSDASSQDSELFVQDLRSPSLLVGFAFANGVASVCIFGSGQIPCLAKYLAIIERLLKLKASELIQIWHTGYF